MARQLPEELLVLDDAAQPSGLGTAAGPLPGRLARAGVVVLGALGHRVDVVPRIAFAAADLADREHERLSRQRAKAPPVQLCACPGGLCRQDVGEVAQSGLRTSRRWRRARAS